MFAAPNYTDAAAELQRKRAHEEDLANNAVGFCEHRNKRVQCLPLRTSPRTSQQWPPSWSTPQNSDSDEHVPRADSSQWPMVPGLPAEQHQEMEMMDVISQTRPLAHGNLNPPINESNGRMPTPIQPSFAAQVRGQQCEWAGPGPAVSALNGVINMGHHTEGLAEELSISRNMAAPESWQAVQNNRRLPSPISEADDCMNSPPMALDQTSGMPTEYTEVPSQSSPSHAMEHPNAMMDVEAQHSQQDADGDEDPTIPSPCRKGHTRNTHTVNHWTWQPGMKKSFSIGYRSDCEKCRLKVPGHFNHIIVS